MPLYKWNVLSSHRIMLALKRTVLLLGDLCLITGRRPSRIPTDGLERDHVFHWTACSWGKSHSVVHLAPYQGLSPVLFRHSQARKSNKKWKSQSFFDRHIPNHFLLVPDRLAHLTQDQPQVLFLLSSCYFSWMRQPNNDQQQLALHCAALCKVCTTWY